MDQILKVYEPGRAFAKDSIRLIKRCTKPDRREFQKIAIATAIGFCIMGFIGFFVKLIHIPINNIIVGNWGPVSGTLRWCTESSPIIDRHSLSYHIRSHPVPWLNILKVNGNFKLYFSFLIKFAPTFWEFKRKRSEMCVATSKWVVVSDERSKKWFCLREGTGRRTGWLASSWE